jgi:membrane fusion protein (multidrug efflux system)
MKSKIGGRQFIAARTGVVAAALLGIQLSGCSGGNAGPGMPMPPPEVTVVTLRTEPVLLERELPGRVSARLVAEVRPQVGGLVRKVQFSEGGMVRAGQVLYQLDDAPMRAALATAQAAVQRAEAAADGARRNAARGGELIKARMISVQDNDNLQTALKQTEAELAAAQAALQSSRVSLDYTRISAPISGRIGKSAVTEGALVVANQAAPLATVQRLDEVYVDVTQSSREWLQLRRELGDGAQGSRRVLITLEDGHRYERPGQLQFTDVTVDDNTGTFLLRVLVPNPEGLLLPGMFVTATVGEGGVRDGLLAPQQGITRDPRGGATALVVGSDGKVQERRLSVLRTVGDKWLIGSGLAAGDRVIIEGLQKVQPGAMVQAKEAAASAAPVAPPAAGAPPKAQG